MNEDIWIVLAFSLLITVVFGLLASLIYIINRSNREAIKIVSKTESDEMDMKDILHVDATIITGLLILVSVSSLLPETVEFEYYGFTFTGEAIVIYLALFAIGPFAVSALYVTWKDEDNARFAMRAGFVMLLGTLAYLFFLNIGGGIYMGIPNTNTSNTNVESKTFDQWYAEGWDAGCNDTTKAAEDLEGKNTPFTKGYQVGYLECSTNKG